VVVVAAEVYISIILNYGRRKTKRKGWYIGEEE